MVNKGSEKQKCKLVNMDGNNVSKISSVLHVVYVKSSPKLIIKYIVYPCALVCTLSMHAYFVVVYFLDFPLSTSIWLSFRSTCNLVIHWIVVCRAPGHQNTEPSMQFFCNKCSDSLKVDAILLERIVQHYWLELNVFSGRLGIFAHLLHNAQ